VQLRAETLVAVPRVALLVAVGEAVEVVEEAEVEAVEVVEGAAVVRAGVNRATLRYKPVSAEQE